MKAMLLSLQDEDLRCKKKKNKKCTHGRNMKNCVVLMEVEISDCGSLLLGLGRRRRTSGTGGEQEIAVGEGNAVDGRAQRRQD